MAAGITRHWALRQEGTPLKWTLGHLYEDGGEPVTCARLDARSVSEARHRAEEWLSAGGDVCERWTPAAAGWIATTRSPA